MKWKTPLILSLGLIAGVFLSRLHPINIKDGRFFVVEPYTSSALIEDRVGVAANPAEVISQLSGDREEPLVVAIDSLGRVFYTSASRIGSSKFMHAKYQK